MMAVMRASCVRRQAWTLRTVASAEAASPPYHCEYATIMVSLTHACWYPLASVAAGRLLAAYRPLARRGISSVLWRANSCSMAGVTLRRFAGGRAGGALV